MELGQVSLLLRSIVKFGLYVLGFWASFRYLFDFSNPQAFGLGLAISTAIDLAAWNKGPTSSLFRPYTFGIYPHVGLMLNDLGLVTDEEFKAAARDVPPYRPWSDMHLFHYPIRAVVISFEPGAKTEVIHWPDLGYYSARLETDIKLKQFELPGRFFGWAPEFFIKGSPDGYSFGIRVREDWWKENKVKVASGVVQDEYLELDFGQVRLALAILPYEVINKFYVKSLPGHQERVKKTVAKRGWENETRGGDFRYRGESYTHNYISVWTDDLE